VRIGGVAPFLELRRLGFGIRNSSDADFGPILTLIVKSLNNSRWSLLEDTSQFEPTEKGLEKGLGCGNEKQNHKISA
jgi:hypothetical protein